MNIKNLKDQKILLFGKPRAFDEGEFFAQLSQHKIECVTQFEEGVSLIVEGRMMSPYEQNESDALYEKKLAPFVSIDLLEKTLVEQIKEDTLMMSLKLSRNKERLLSFLKNRIISDTLYFKLLAMYDWGGEDFFENDSNRDVTAALIRRFYQNIERNHNVEYATLGLMHLLSQTNKSELIETIFSLEPLQSGLHPCLSILEAIVRNPVTPQSVLEKLMHQAPRKILILLAQREDCPNQMQKALLSKGDLQIDEALSMNAALDTEILQTFIQRDARGYLLKSAKNIKLTEGVYELLSAYEEALACNKTLSYEMQKKLFERGDTLLWCGLASNVSLHKDLFVELWQKENMQVNLLLYANPAAPQEILEKGYDKEIYHLPLAGNRAASSELLGRLAQTQHKEVLIALAQNPSTPVAVLYQLQLDTHLQKYVKENPSFGLHIQSQNIGWMVEGMI